MSQRDDFVNFALGEVGQLQYKPWGDRCGWSDGTTDCSGLCQGAGRRAGMVFAGCPNSAGMAVLCHNAPRPQWMNQQFGPDPWSGSTMQGTGISKGQARATKGALKFHGYNQGIDGNGPSGHEGISLGDGRSVEALNSALDVRIWTFDDDRTTYCALWPGMAGFDQAPGTNPDPNSPWEASVMGMIAEPVPGAHQNANGRVPFVAAVNNADTSADIKGFNGATFQALTPQGVPTGPVMTTLHFAHLNAPIEDSSVVFIPNPNDPHHYLIPTHRIVFMASDGGTFGPYTVAGP